MRRNFGVLAFAAVVLSAGVASAQFPPANNVQSSIPGVPASGTPTSTNEGHFTASATINSVFQFTVNDSTIDCGVVSYNDTNGQQCTDHANFNVDSNNNWQASINNGLSYSATVDADISRLKNLDTTNYGSSEFDFHLIAEANNPGSGINVVTGQQTPTSSTDVFVTASYNTSTTNSPSTDAVDPTDGHGDYTGDFVIVLSEP